MKKRIITVLLALVLMVAVVPSNVLADTTIYSGSAGVTVIEPITFVYTGTDGTYNDTTHTWNADIVGSGNKQFKITATNNNTTNGITITAIVTPSSSVDGKVTATWNSASRYLAPSSSYEFVLTVSALAGVAIGDYPFSISFTRP